MSTDVVVYVREDIRKEREIELFSDEVLDSDECLEFIKEELDQDELDIMLYFKYETLETPCQITVYPPQENQGPKNPVGGR